VQDGRAGIVAGLVFLAIFVVLVIFVTWYHFFDKSLDRKDRGFWKWLRDLLELLWGL